MVEFSMPNHGKYGKYGKYGNYGKVIAIIAKNSIIKKKNDNYCKLFQIMQVLVKICNVFF